MVKIKQLLIVLIIILLVNPISFAQIILAEGTEADETFIEIENSDDLAKIKDNLTENYILTKDIDLEEVEWEPIDQGEFTGALKGDDYKIKNMPAKYLDDESFGLFTEVEDISNIDVKVKFAEDDADEPQVEGEAAEEEKDELQVEEEAAEEEEDEPQVEKKAAEEEKKEPQAEKETVKEDFNNEKNNLAQNRAVVSKGVYNHGDLKEALKDDTITEINLKADISKRSNLSNRIDIAPREVVINGNGYELRQNSSGALSDAMFRADLAKGKETQITFKDIDLVSKNGNSVITQTGESGVDWNVIFENVNKNVKSQPIYSSGRLVNAKNAHVTFRGNNRYLTGGTPTIINEAKSVFIEKSDIGKESDKTFINTQGTFYKTSHDGAKLEIEGKLDIDGDIGKNSVIEFNGPNSKIIVKGNNSNDSEQAELVTESSCETENYNFRIKSERKPSGWTTGLIKFTDKKADFSVINGAKVHFCQTSGTILYMNSVEGKINIKDKSKVSFLTKGKGVKDVRYDAVIHLDYADEKAEKYEINLDGGAHLDVHKTSGLAMGIRVGKGKGHQVNVRGGSRLSVHNKGNGEVTDPSDIAGTNQALQFNSISIKDKTQLPKLKVDGLDSEVELKADSGVAMHMSGGGDVYVGKDTSFIAHGITKKNSVGIIDTGGPIDDYDNGDRGSTFTMNSPAFYDFRNNNTSGLVFNPGADSRFIGENTDMAVWKRGPNTILDGRHDKRWVDVNYTFSGVGFKDLKSDSTNLEAEMNKSTDNSTGLKKYARISGNNASPIVDKLYQSTNADKKIYAHVSIDEGIFGTRNANSEEVEVDVEVKQGEKSIGGSGHTIGENHEDWANEEVYEIYGKKVDENIGAFGWAEIKLEDNSYLEAGDTIEVSDAKIIGTNKHISSEKDLHPDSLIVVDVTPPKPTELKTKELTTSSTVIEGNVKETDLDATVIIEIKDKVVAEDIPIESDGTWEYEFENELKIGEKVQAFLNDNSGPTEDVLLGSEKDLDRPTRPKTNNDRGNVNPKEIEYIYHDKTFKGAPLIKLIGELKLESIPSELNFTAKIKSKEHKYLMNPISDSDEHLIVSDTRENKDKAGWVLEAKMSEPFTVKKDETKKLTDKLSLIYREDGKEDLELNDSNQIVKSHEYKDVDEESFNLSENWIQGQDKDGMFINVKPGIMKGNYSGKATWTLSDAPQGE